MSIPIETTETAPKIPNPLLERLNKIPGITIKLPSVGLFYNNGELDPEVVEGEILILPMTTTDDLVMRSTDMLFQGTAIDHVLKRCAPQIKKPLELLVSDIDYILTELRKISYGNKLPIDYDCTCAKTEEEQKARKAAGTNEYLIPIDSLIDNSKELSLKEFNDNFKITLSTGHNITLQPMRFSDYLRIHQMREDNLMNDIDAMREYIAINYSAVTLSVDGITDREQIKELYKFLPRKESEKIKKKLDSMTPWGIDFTYKITCRHCNEEKDITTHLNPVYFFMLPSSPETEIT